jgi:sporulation protein YlmC with PRC-barrel domain
MEFRENAEIYTADNEKAGHLERVVIDPQTREVTHLVVRQGFIFSEDKVVPLSLVAAAAAERIVLRAEAGDLEDLPQYQQEQFVPLVEAERERLEAAAAYGAPIYPYFTYPPPGLYDLEVETNLPSDVVPLAEGASVTSIEGQHVGDVERILADSQTDRVTHLVISRGVILKERKLIPIQWVSQIKPDELFLAVGTRMLESLRPYED